MSAIDWTPVEPASDSELIGEVETFLRGTSQPDEEPQEIPLAMFVMECGITIDLESIDRSGWARQNEGAMSFRVTFARTGSDRTMTVDWSCGAAWRSRDITPMDVLDSIRMDAETGEQGYQDFVWNFGKEYATRELWQACEETARDLKAFLSDEDGGDKLYRDLLDRVERQ